MSNVKKKLLKGETLQGCKVSPCSRNGFTLIELLAVVIVIIVVGGLTIGIITSSLRGTKKTDTINEVRQNGNYAILQVARTISYAKSFDGVSTDGQTYKKDCVVSLPPAPTPTLTPTQYKYVRIISFDQNSTVFSCTQTSPLTIVSNTASLINTNSVVLKANSCFFTCTQERITSSITIGINFTLEQKDPGIFAESIVKPIPFQTSVTVRNLIK